MVKIHRITLACSCVIWSEATTTSHPQRVETAEALRAGLDPEKALGNGLGLATVKAIMEQAGGSVTIESQAGRGTTVSLILPAAAHWPEPPGRIATPFNFENHRTDSGNRCRDVFMPRRLAAKNSPS